MFSLTEEFDTEQDSYVRDICRAQAEQTINDMLENVPGVLEAAFKAIPAGWTYDSNVHGNSPSPFTFVQAYFVEQFEMQALKERR